MRTGPLAHFWLENGFKLFPKNSQGRRRRQEQIITKLGFLGSKLVPDFGTILVLDFGTKIVPVEPILDPIRGTILVPVLGAFLPPCY